MGVKISLITITYRPGYIDNLVAGILNQSMPKDDFEWILVDDLWELRKSVVHKYIGDRFRYRHIPPREITHLCGTTIAFNTGLRACDCDSKLVYSMADYIYMIGKECLSRHYELYDIYGPRVLISGGLIDGITSTGKSLIDERPKMITVDIGGKITSFPECTPPIEFPMKKDYRSIVPSNFISIWDHNDFENVFSLPDYNHNLDWRSLECMLIADRCLTSSPMVIEILNGNWFWCGRNDSVAKAGLVSVGGLEELNGVHGGLEAAMANELIGNHGYKYLIDYYRMNTCVMLPHPYRKPENPEPVRK